VKHLVFALVALTSCASWKQKDFVKELITQYGKENDLPEEKTL
jgi:hypothetical protein